MAALSRAHRFTPRSSAGSSILSWSERKAARAYNSRILHHAGTAPLGSTPGGRGARPIIAGPTDNLQLLGVRKSGPEAKVHPDRHSALSDLNAAGAGGLRAPAGSRRLADSGLDDIPRPGEAQAEGRSLNGLKFTGPRLAISVSCRIAWPGRR